MLGDLTQNSVRNNFYYSPRASHYNGPIRDITHNHRICTDYSSISNGNAPQNFCTRTYLDAIPDFRSTQGIFLSAITDSYLVANKTVVTNFCSSVNDNAAMVLYMKSAPDFRGRSDCYSTKYFNQLVKNHVDNSPRQSDPLIRNDKSRAAESINNKRPKTQTQQPFPLRLQVFKNYIHTATL